uniref:Vacuolar iron transporter n=1 Tax=Anthurium amnicola TaxID=1678845 RepID=A0A1D1XPW1_9ARAE
MSSILEMANPSSDETSSIRYETVPDEEGAEGAERVHHVEKRFHYSEIIKDITIGLADGLTVPFALAAGLSSVGNRHLVILGCLAELMASTISKTVGGWATLKTAEQHFLTERNREILEVKNNLEAEIQEMIDVMQPYELDAQALAPIIDKLVNSPENFVDFRMKFESDIEKPDSARSMSSLIIGTSYFISGLIPLIPYFFIRDCLFGLYISSAITFTCFILFGYIKALYNYPSKAMWGAVQSIVVGFLSAAVAYGFVLLIRHHNDLFEFM